MALIKCKECGHEVSDRASMCPNCGCPIESLGAAQEEVIYEEPKKKKGWIWALIVALLCLIGGGGYYAYIHLVNKNNAEDIVELTPNFIKAIEKYDKLGAFSEGLAAVCKDGKWGYINTKGEEIIPANINATCVGRFSEGLAFVLYWEDAKFAVIDRTGKIVFTKEAVLFTDMGNIQEDGANLPLYENGKLNVCVHIGDDIYDGEWKDFIYDTKGNKVGENDGSPLEGNAGQYELFTQEHGQHDDYHWYTVGLKDSQGKEILPAIYDEISFAYAKDSTISNGVVLVRLDIIGNDAIEGGGGEWDSNETKSYYGYADMKGNDTFSKEIKQKSADSHERAANKLHQEAEENERIMKEGPDWLQGAWRLELTDDYGNHLGYMYEVFNHGSSKSYIDDRLLLEHDYTVSDDMIMYDKGHYQLDNTRQIVLGANGKEMQKISDDPYYTPNSSSSQSSSSSYSNNSSSSSKGYRFSSPQDVIGWLADKSFFNGSRRLRIRPNGVWLNDYCATGAPNVERWESWKALIRAYTATGERLSFFVVPINGTVTDEASDVFSLR